ncbi:hypothetical protein DL767_000892 [Monosporascus sp. MG133]|nr:hypothetical protein DL767_000892 [Monosporascus sp. MG133]
MPGLLDNPSATISPAPSCLGGNLTKAIRSGTLDESKIDDMARRIFTPTYNYPDEDLTLAGMNPNNPPPARGVCGEHAEVVRKSPKLVGVFGNGAADVSEGLTFTGDDSGPWGANTGALSVGGGSGAGRLTRLISPLYAIRNRTESAGRRVRYLLDNHTIVHGDFTSIYPTAEVRLLFLKTWTRESTDRLSFENDWHSTTVVENVARRCPSTVVITHAGGVSTMPWAENPNVTAILPAHYPGQENGNSIVDGLYGDVNPSGRLRHTITKQPSNYDFPIVSITEPRALDPSAWQADFTEGLLVDYRHFDAKNINPLYELGCRLSYTTFELERDMKLTGKARGIAAYPAPANGSYPEGNPSLWEEVASVTATVKNTGNMAGAQVVQLYVPLPQEGVPSNTPVQVLRGFEKVVLNSAQSKPVKLSIMRRDLTFWNTTAQD